jgi:hypothetical protein
MACVSGRARGTRPAVAWFKLGACALAGGGLLLWMSDRGLWGGWGEGLFGFYLGLVTWHFIIDADIWRMREKFQRDFLTRAFPFLARPH